MKKYISVSQALMLVFLSLFSTLVLADEDSNKWLKDLATIGTWALVPIVMIGIVAISDNFKDRRRTKLIELFITSGKDIPVELLEQIKTDKWKSKDVRTPEEKYRDDLGYGVFFLCLGMGVGLALSLIFEPKTGLWSLIFIFMGIGCLLNALFISGKAYKNTQELSHKAQPRD